jgi:hypothetical protein
MKKEIIWKSGAIVFAILLVFAIATAGFTNFDRFSGISETGLKEFSYANKLSSGNADVDLFVMSKCPYGTQAEDSFAEVVKTLKDTVNLNVEFIGDYQDGQFTALHGEPEVIGNKIQLCVKEYFPEKFLDFALCQNENYQEIPTNWEGCATRLSLDTETLGECFTGDKGNKLLKDSYAKADKAEVTGSPTIFIEGERYNGGRDPLSLMMAICSVTDSEECNELPECTSNAHCTEYPSKVGTCSENACAYVDPVDFDGTIINDKTCSSCDSTQIVGALSSMFKGLDMKTLDISSTQATELVEDLGITYLPAYIFEKEITQTNSWKADPKFRSYFVEGEEYFLLRNEVVGSKYYATEEMRNAHMESLGIKTGDNRPQIDFFVMSYCPYGNIAEEAIFEAYPEVKDSVDFNPHYIYYSGYGGGGPEYCLDENDVYCSMHGIQELNQGIRELCVKNEYGIDAWFDFAIAANDQCNYENVDECWEGVAQSLGYDVNTIATCEATQGLTLAEEDFKLTQLYGAQGSPAVYIDGVEYQGPRSGDGYLQSICEGFEDAPAICDKDFNVAVPTQTAAPSAAACGV